VRPAKAPLLRLDQVADHLLDAPLTRGGGEPAQGRRHQVQRRAQSGSVNPEKRAGTAFLPSWKAASRSYNVDKPVGIPLDDLEVFFALVQCRLLSVAFQRSPLLRSEGSQFMGHINRKILLDPFNVLNLCDVVENGDYFRSSLKRGNTAHENSISQR